MLPKILMAMPVLAVAVVAWWIFAVGPMRDPESALRDFYEAEDRNEEELCDPLILVGPRAVPPVIADLLKKGMRRRLYLIRFLGNGGYLRALPVLEQVLGDNEESVTFREAAFKAIYQISPQRGRQLAPVYGYSRDRIARVAEDIAAGRDPHCWTRTYWQAFRHAHAE
jgi:HEAT repeat protein